MSYLNLEERGPNKQIKPTVIGPGTYSPNLKIRDIQNKKMPPFLFSKGRPMPGTSSTFVPGKPKNPQKTPPTSLHPSSHSQAQEHTPQTTKD
jgi:hypothetical protein